MHKLAEIVNNRSTPGILIFDMCERLVFSNSEMNKIMPRLDCGSVATESNVPRDVLNLYRSMKNKMEGASRT